MDIAGTGIFAALALLGLAGFNLWLLARAAPSLMRALDGWQAETEPAYSPTGEANIIPFPRQAIIVGRYPTRQMAA